MRTLTPDERDYLTSIDVSACDQSQADAICDLLFDLDPFSGPLPSTDVGRLTAAILFLRLLQQNPLDDSWMPAYRKPYDPSRRAD